MRGDPDSAPALRRVLSTVAGRLLLAAGALLIAVLATGATRSPLLPLLVAAVILLLRHVPRPVVLLAPPATALLLLAAAALLGEPAGVDLLAAAALLLAAVPGLLWRREAKRRGEGVAQLPDAGGAQPEPLQPQADADHADVSDLELALRAVAARIGAASVVLWHVDAWHGTARPVAAAPARPAGRLRLSGDPLGWVWEEGMRLRIDPRPRWAEPGTTVFADRLRRHGEYGELVTYAFAPVAAADATALDEAAVYLRGVLALSEARAGASADRRRLHALAAGLRAIPGSLRLESLANDLCHTALAITGGTGAAIGTWDGERGELLAVVGADGGPRAGDAFAPPESELALAMLAGTMIVRRAGEWTLGRTSVAHDRERWVTRPRAFAALPLRGASATPGVLAVWTSDAPALEADGLELLHALAPYAALHLEHARSFGQVQETAERDPLTHLRNRRGFDAIFDAERMRFERYGRPASLLILDLDHFKSINDRHGHEAGDEVLRRVAALLTASIRDVDTAARFGGEEFVVLLPETALGAALEVAERIRTAVAAEPVAWGDTGIPVSVSVGVSTCPGTAAEPGDLIGSADAALYRAKAAGRNRSVAADLL